MNLNFLNPSTFAHETADNNLAYFQLALFDKCYAHLQKCLKMREKIWKEMLNKKVERKSVKKCVKKCGKLLSKSFHIFSRNFKRFCR